MTEAPKIFSKVSAIMADTEAITKARKNQQQGYNFRGIDDVYNALHAIFAKHEVFFTSEVINSIREERQTSRGGTLIYSILDVKFTFYAADGSNISSVMRGEGMDSGDKASNKAMSTALKYALFQLLLIPTQDPDSDTENQHHEVRPRAAQQAQPKPASQLPNLYPATEKQMGLAERLLKSSVFDDLERTQFVQALKSGKHNPSMLIDRIKSEMEKRKS